MSNVIDELHKVVFEYPAIDNHTHALLKKEHRDDVPLEGLFEAKGEAMKDTPYGVSAMRAAHQLGTILGLTEHTTWEEVKKARSEMDYGELCETLMSPTKIACLLLDDGLGGVAEMAEDWTWHRRFGCSVFRIVRLETEAENLLVQLLEGGGSLTVDRFTDAFIERVVASASLPEVVGFKSVACYRTGLDITTTGTTEAIAQALAEIAGMFKDTGKIRISHKAFNDHVVRIGLEVAGKYNKPVQFHTGLGDNDIKLALSSPAHMQPIIKAYPKTTFILLHSSYPYTRDAGYLTLVYSNVFLDFGEIFPMVSAHGQLSVVRQMFEVAPTNKILWSTDGHWFPETYYLGSLQSRQALYTVLKEMIVGQHITEPQAIGIVENVLFHNSNRVYRLGLERPTLS